MGAQEKWKAGKQACPPSLPFFSLFVPLFIRCLFFPPDISPNLSPLVGRAARSSLLSSVLPRLAITTIVSTCRCFPLSEILKRHLRTKTSAFGNDSTSSKDELRHATYFSYDFEHACKLSSCRSGERSNQRTTDRERGRGDVDSFLPLSLHRNSGE